MNTRRFVSGSSVILAGWLGATFFNEVPAQRYPKLDKKPATAAVTSEPGLLVAEAKPVASPVSASR
jgi:hypothetical protein